MSTLWQELEYALTESQLYLQPARKEKTNIFRRIKGFIFWMYSQWIDKRQIVCVRVCVFVFWLLVGLPQKDGITDEGRTVFYVLPAGSCWEYLLYHIMSVAETVQ